MCRQKSIFFLSTGEKGNTNISNRTSFHYRIQWSNLGIKPDVKDSFDFYFLTRHLAAQIKKPKLKIYSGFEIDR